MRIAILILTFCAPLWAGPKHWIETHKLPLAAAAASFTVQSLNAVTSIQAEERDPRGIDFGFFGPHPTHGQVWIGTELFAVSATGFSLLAYHFAPDSVGKKFVTALWVIPLTASGASDIQNNVDTPRLAARQRLMRSRVSRLSTNE